MKLIRYLFLIIDSAIYSFISYAYQMFNFMSQIRIFEGDEMKDLANRIYILIGVVAMFFVAYALICAIINPENATKGKNSSVTGIVKNIIFAIIGIALVPSIFNFAYDFQEKVLCSNLIEKLFLGNNVNGDTDSNANMGNQLELLLFKSFYYIAHYEEDTNSGTVIKDADDSVWYIAANNIQNYNNNKSLYDAFQSIESGEGTIAEELNGFDVSIHEGTIKYLFLLSTIAGLYCAYVLLGFVIDMGVRSVKLAYLQLIAPLPIFSMVIPGQKKVFDNWIKKTSACFMEVFVRVIAMTFAFYAIKYLRPWIFGKGMNEVVCGANTIGGTTKLLAQAVYILGIFAFLKQLPKFISDLLPGFDSKGFKLGLGNALAETGGLQMLGAAGGMVTAGTRNFAATSRKAWNSASAAWKNGDKKGAIFKGIGGAAATAASTVAGAASGGTRAFVKGKDSKKWSDVAKYAGEGADAAMEAKLKREDYKRAHGDSSIEAAISHVKDAFDNNVKDFPNSHRANFNYENQKHQSIDKIVKAEGAIDSQVKSLLESKKANLEYTDANGVTKTLLSIRNEKDDAEQEYNSAVQALAQAKVDGNIDKINNAKKALAQATQNRDTARQNVLNAEKQIKSDIRLGNADAAIGAENAANLKSLYEDYKTAVTENYSSLSGNPEAYERAQSLLKENDFRTSVEGNTYKDKQGNTVTATAKFIENVKVADANVVTEMNKEGEAARKQQEKK